MHDIRNVPTCLPKLQFAVHFTGLPVERGDVPLLTHYCYVSTSETSVNRHQNMRSGTLTFHSSCTERDNFRHPASTLFDNLPAPPQHS